MVSVFFFFFDVDGCCQSAHVVGKSLGLRMLCVNWLPQITCGMNVRLASRTEVSPGQRVIQEVQPPEYVVWTRFSFPLQLFALFGKQTIFFLFSTDILLPFSVSSFFHHSFNVLFYFQFPSECLRSNR